MPSLSSLYLLGYNSLQAFGWAVCLINILGDFLSTGTINGAYASAGDLICLMQVSAFLEVIHGATGLVSSGMLFPLMQWAGRTHVILMIIRQIKEVQESPAAFIILTAWSLSEVIRYPHHALNCIGKCPYWLVYLRYTAFIVLYPTGESAEIWIIYKSLSYIKKMSLFGDIFPSFPFLYYNFLSVFILIYPLLWLKLYLHLFKQRKSKLGNGHGHEKKKKKK